MPSLRSASRTTCPSRALGAAVVAGLAAAVLVVGPVVGSPTTPPVSTASAATCPSTAGQKLSTTPATHPRTVSLTFDDGPTTFTPQILDILNARGVRGVFFVTGKQVQAHPDIARRIVREGHVIANHTWSHPQAVAGSVPYGRFDSLPAGTQVDQINRTTDVIRSVTGATPCFFRGPGGWHNTALTSQITRDRGLTIAHWSHSSGDSGQTATTTKASTDAIVSRSVTTHAHPIVLFHDGKASPEPEAQVTSNRSNTVAALPRVIDSYKSRGYVFTDPAGRKLATTVIKPVDRAAVQDHVAALYADLLKRNADAGDLKFWTDKAVAAGGDTTGMTNGITRSTEYRNREIDDAYRLVLGRAADAGGRDTWRAAVARGQVRLEDIPVDLLASKEFYHRNGGTDAGFVTGMYRTVLGREVDRAGHTYWTTIVGTKGRRAAILGIWNSYEATAGRVDGLYQEFLQRGVDPTGRTTWTTKAQKYGDEWVRDQLIRSAEYRSEARQRF